MSIHHRLAALERVVPPVRRLPNAPEAHGLPPLAEFKRLPLSERKRLLRSVPASPETEARLAWFRTLSFDERIRELRQPILTPHKGDLP